MLKIEASQLDQVLLAQMKVAEVLKGRFPNLTVNEVNVIASQILMAIQTVTA